MARVSCDRAEGRVAGRRPKAGRPARFTHRDHRSRSKFRDLVGVVGRGSRVDPILEKAFNICRMCINVMVGPCKIYPGATRHSSENTGCSQVRRSIVWSMARVSCDGEAEYLADGDGRPPDGETVRYRAFITGPVRACCRCCDHVLHSALCTGFFIQATNALSRRAIALLYNSGRAVASASLASRTAVSKADHCAPSKRPSRLG
ncbi:hypothetical protein BSL78_10263 [Apostichopus japonicus]|uniref:Uncharacterized protein n=1 Tax=Stichopus japonicus TaxID=307972 RepID=A0A2G8KY47_STIJA|nr:hypothetical protein BSL78_10263 [Apostichopus japonicus]